MQIYWNDNFAIVRNWIFHAKLKGMQDYMVCYLVICVFVLDKSFKDPYKKQQ